jgi:hypothetical protein
VPRLLVAGSERIGTITRAGENEAGENEATRRGDMSSERLIDYEALAQDAMRGVVRTILTRVGKTGLPGDHHFYISFNTSAEGVSISKRLKEKYRDEMTIVLQHRFWDLVVTDDRFEVKLTFDGIPERLVVPFAAIKVFFDPSVRYGLQFEEPAGDHGSAALHSLTDSDVDGEVPRATTTRSASPRKPRPQRKPRADKESATPAPLSTVGGSNANGAAAASPPPPVRPAPAPVAVAEEPQKPAEEKPAGAQIVSLDQFRKK